ncbi:MAG TPA: LptA/OstA family protein, partial [Nitrosospira sp.]|nr:LptA/OstA family protein [Nitrosospira sp.]
MRPAFTIFVIGMLFISPVLAEKADKDQPVHLESDRATVQEANKLATFTGNVVLTQGTLIIRADK